MNSAVVVLLAVVAIAALWLLRARAAAAALERKVLADVARWKPVRGCVWEGCTFLVVINPFSGKRRARQVFSTIVKPMLDAAGVVTESICTRSSEHVTEIARGLNVDDYDAVLVMSGDGTLREFIHALGTEAGSPGRFRDWLSRIAFGLIPVGSSNGLTASLHMYSPFNAMEIMLNCKEPKPLDLLELQQEGRASEWDMHMTSWGITSEYNDWLERRLRWLPLWLRLLLAPAIVIGKRPTYRGTVHFQPVMPPDELLEKGAAPYNDPRKLPESDKAPGWRRLDGPFILFGVMNTRSSSDDTIMAPNVKPAGGEVDVVCLRNGSRLQLLDTFEKLTPGTHLQDERAEAYKASAVVIDPIDGAHMDVSGGELPKALTNLIVHDSMARFLY